MSALTIEDLIGYLDLKPLWNGDYIGEFYTSPQMISKECLGPELNGTRPIGTWAYYLLTQGSKCPLHLMFADESWQYCAGGNLDLFLISPNGELETITVGPDLAKGHRFIHIVPRGYWFGAKPWSDSAYTLVTHNVAPGYQDGDFVKGYRQDLERRFPHLASSVIRDLAWPED